jgi:Xaa-Pro aminopeptidase
MPTARALSDSELLLVDAGAECRGEAAIAACRSGVEWREVHRAAALVVADGLAELGVLRGRRDSLLESGAVTLFFPHGVGHMVGLGIRDTGLAYDETRARAGTAAVARRHPARRA